MEPVPSSSEERLFPAHLRHAAWRQFKARGYRKPVTGVIYRGEPRPTCGMPLGGLDTGCVDIEPNGMLGYSTLFNHLINPRLLLNQPFLGLSVDGASWVLVSDRLEKKDSPVLGVTPLLFPPIDYTPRYSEIELKDVQIADSIDYWGHYPIVDMEFNTTAPVEVGLRAWSPFLPGDTVASMMPAAVFDFSLRNPGAEHHRCTLAFSWPGFEVLEDEPSGQRVCRTRLEGPLSGMYVTSGQSNNAFAMEYVLAADVPHSHPHRRPAEQGWPGLGQYRRPTAARPPTRNGVFPGF